MTLFSAANCHTVCLIKPPFDGLCVFIQVTAKDLLTVYQLQKVFTSNFDVKLHQEGMKFTFSHFRTAHIITYGWSSLLFLRFVTMKLMYNFDRMANNKLHGSMDFQLLKEYYEIVNEVRPLSVVFPTDTDLFE